jgi:class 3 adenylate cyclase
MLRWDRRSLGEGTAVPTVCLSVGECHHEGVADRRLCGILLTDLEGSTAHLRALGDDYATVLGRHHDIIRTAIAADQGRELGSEGDSFAAVFSTTADALGAAVSAQRNLANVAWPDSPWRVRMAVHAGTVEFADAGVVGIGLHEAARVRAVAHGGQIVVTDDARAGVGAALPDGVVLVDLGRHSVRDFAGPVRLHQASTPGLPAAFPPLRTMAARPVPTARTPFVGRADELDELGGSLPSRGW